jgi:putative FmdB family regulatory protein
MPVYEYECKHCGAGTERRRSVDERNDTFRCEHCQAECAMVRVPSLTAFALKGTGWTAKGPGAPATPARRAKRSAGYDMTGSRHDD